jgi:hypothetical protein
MRIGGTGSPEGSNGTDSLRPGIDPICRQRSVVGSPGEGWYITPCKGPEESTCGVVQGSRGGRTGLLEVDRCCRNGHGQGRKFG